jgi:hypothetical protein
LVRDLEAAMRRVPVLICVAAVLLLATAGPASAAGGWTVQYPPNPAGSINSSLNGVSCAVSSTCIAVGGYYVPASNTDLSLAEEWNGSSWVIQPTPNPSGSVSAGFVAVSCPVAAQCEGVGGYSTAIAGADSPLAEQWNGTAWAIQSTPALAYGGDFSGVSCPSASVCIAVGTAYTSNNTDNLAEKWNGTNWSRQIMPTPTGGAGLSAVSCPSATSCTAIGDSGGVSGVTLAEGWDGSSWTIESTPDPHGYGFPLGISCTAVTTCTSTGEYFVNYGGTTDTLAYQLN